MDEGIKEVGEMATIEGEEEITIEEDYTALEAETIIIDDDSNIQTDAEYEQAVEQKELADEAREALSAVLLSVLEKGEINDDDIAEITAQQEIYIENVTALKILGIETEDEKSTTNVITSNIDYDELMKALSEKADWLYTDEDGQIMLNGEVVPKIGSLETNLVTANNNIISVSSKQTALEQNLNGFKQTVSDTYTTKTEFGNLRIGGANLLKTTKLLENKSGSSSWEVTNTGREGFKKLQIVTTDATNWIECQIPLYTTINSLTSKVTISFEYQETTAKLLAFSFASFNGSTRLKEIANVIVADTFKVLGTREGWKRVSYTFDPTSVNGQSDATTYKAQFKKVNDKSGKVYVRKIKLEIGTMATEWTPAPQDTEDYMDSIETRVQSAESKLTKSSLTTTIGNYYTTSTDVNGIITSKGYATTSEVTQTADALTAKFTNSGGYNLIRNSGGLLDTNSWSSSDMSLYIGSGGDIPKKHSSGKCFVAENIDTAGHFVYSSRIQLRPNTKYTLSGIVTASGSCNGVDVHVIENTAIDGSGTSTYSRACGYGTNDWWKKFKYTFTTKSDTFSCRLRITNKGATSTEVVGKIHFGDLLLEEGEVAHPWSPHPNEVRSGITQIDATGIKVFHDSIDSNSYTHISPSGFYLKNRGTNVFKVDSNGLYLKGNGEFTGTISASTINGGVINGSTINSDSFIGDVLAIDGVISAKALQVQDIDNTKYPATLAGNLEIYVNSSSGNDDNEPDDSVRFKTLQGAINAIPKFLNGKTVYITMETNSTEDVYIRGVVGGAIKIYMNGKTLYGTLRTYACSATVTTYGGTKDNTEGATGIIHPKVGLSFGSRAVSVGFEASQYCALYKVKVFAPDSLPSDITNTDKVCVASQSGTGSVYCKNIQIVNAVIGFRANNHGSMHINSSSGVASKYGFQSATGGIISIANNAQTGGNTGSTNKGSGGQIWYDTNGPTFATGNQSTDSTTAPVVSTTKTLTVKSTYGDTYRSSVYNNWKKDGTVRQGDYGYGDCNGCWFFGSAFSEVKGKTISKVTITIHRQRGGVSSAVGLVVKSHGHSSRPSGAPTYRTTAGTLSLAVGASDTLTITNSTILNEISSGVVKGFGIQGTYDSAHYAVCSGSVTVKIYYKE